MKNEVKKLEEKNENIENIDEVDFKKVNTKKMSLQEIEQVKENVEERHVEFVKLIEKIDIAPENYRVLLILGENELVYDTGEFYIGETLNPQMRKKISRKQAQSIFVDYYVRHHINSDVKEKVEKNEVIETNKVKHVSKEKNIEVKGMAADILKEREEKLSKTKKVEAKPIEEQIELM